MPPSGQAAGDVRGKKSIVPLIGGEDFPPSEFWAPALDYLGSEVQEIREN